MSKTVRLGGEAENILEMLLSIISATTTDPLFHISEIVQNEMDADASEINITLYRKGGKKGKVSKIVIDGDGFGFLESFEHYSNNVCDSIKKYSKEYQDRAEKGLSRGQFCIGIQGFRAVCDEVQIVSLTRKGVSPKTIENGQIEDPDFPRMFANRKLILKSNTLDAAIKEEEEFNDHRIMPGVTCTLLRPKVAVKSSALVKYLSQNKRAELLANRKLKIVVNDGTFAQVVKPIEYQGERIEFDLGHPRERRSPKYRGFGRLKATLYFHEAKPGSKIRLDVKKEPIYFDITNLQEFDGPPWNSEFVEGIVEYPYLEKSPLRSGIERDNYFFPAFLEMMNALARRIKGKAEEYEEKSKAKRDEELLRKLERVYGEVKRELDFSSWFDKKVEELRLGPLDHIKLFPEVVNVPAFATRRIHVRAYDADNQTLKEKDDIEFEWRVVNDLGTVMPKGSGEAIFKAGSKVGATTVEASVRDLRTEKTLDSKMEIVITYPPGKSGKLARVKIDPMFSKLPLGSEKEYKAMPEDEDRNTILKGVTFQWSIAFDETGGAKLNIDYGESVILSPGRNLGTIRLQVTAYQDGRSESDFAMVTVVKKRKKAGRPKKPRGLDLPVPDPYNDPNEFPLRHSYLSLDGTLLNVNEGHPDCRNAQSMGKRRYQRYVANLYAKELAQKECEATGSTDLGEKMLDVLSKIDRFW
ncbi:MAG: hypothetical protein ACW99J_15830 [Candidatus Thorarchaeota archaeon]|jgi:hypothetical protein